LFAGVAFLFDNFPEDCFFYASLALQAGHVNSYVSMSGICVYEILKSKSLQYQYPHS
jgi:hypothetical protein